MFERREIARFNANHAAPGAVDICNQKKGDCDHKGEDHEQANIPLKVARTKADQYVGAYRNRRHQSPSGIGDAIPPRRLHIALGIQNIIHS